MKDIYDFGVVLKELRRKRNMTQSDLGKRLGLTKAAVSKYESGIAAPPLDTLRSISALFNVSLDYLCGTEQREKISVYNLTDRQITIVKSLVDLFRENNKNKDEILSANEYKLLGEILVELAKTNT